MGWLNRRRTAEYSPSTINRERQFLQGFFQRAVEDEVISKNPWKGIPKEACEPRIRVLTPDEEAKLREVMTPRLQRWLTFMLGTGLRIKEACAITVEHIDFEKHTLTVPAEAAKYRKSRVVPFRDEVERVIKEQLAECGKLWNAIPQSYRKDLTKAREKAEVPPPVSPHTLPASYLWNALHRAGRRSLLADEGDGPQQRGNHPAQLRPRK